MKTNVARQSEHLRTILNIHYSYLEGVAEKIAESNELMNEENKEVLTVFQKKYITGPAGIDRSGGKCILR